MDTYYVMNPTSLLALSTHVHIHMSLIQVNYHSGSHFT